MPGPRRIGRNRGDIKDRAARFAQVGQQAPGQFGQGAHVQVDHGALFVTVERSESAAESRSRHC